MVCPCYVHFGTQNCHVERRIRRSVVDRRSLCRPFAHFMALLSTVEPALDVRWFPGFDDEFRWQLWDEFKRKHGDLRAARERRVPGPSTTIDELMIPYRPSAPAKRPDGRIRSGDQPGSAIYADSSFTSTASLKRLVLKFSRVIFHAHDRHRRV